jgi:hypothetical protein
MYLLTLDLLGPPSTSTLQITIALVMSLSTTFFNAWKLIERKILSWIAPVIQFPLPTKTTFLSLVLQVDENVSSGGLLPLGLLHCSPHPFPADKSSDFAMVCTDRLGS